MLFYRKLILSDLCCLNITLLTDFALFKSRKTAPYKVTAEPLRISKSMNE